MRIIHNIRSSNQTKVLLKILKSGYLIKSKELEENNFGIKLNAIYFNLYDKNLYKESKSKNINIILKPNFLINKDFYICLGNNYEMCIDDVYKFNLKNKTALLYFKRLIKKQIQNYTINMYNSIFNNNNILSNNNNNDNNNKIIKPIKLKPLKKQTEYHIEKHIYAYSYSHEILLTENININNIEEIIIQYYDIDATIEEISNYLKINYPKIKLTIIT